METVGNKSGHSRRLGVRGPLQRLRQKQVDYTLGEAVSYATLRDELGGDLTSRRETSRVASRLRRQAMDAASLTTRTQLQATIASLELTLRI